MQSGVQHPGSASLIPSWCLTESLYGMTDRKPVRCRRNLQGTRDRSRPYGITFGHSKVDMHNVDIVETVWKWWDCGSTCEHLWPSEKAWDRARGRETPSPWTWKWSVVPYGSCVQMKPVRAESRFWRSTVRYWIPKDCGILDIFVYKWNPYGLNEVSQKYRTVCKTKPVRSPWRWKWSVVPSGKFKRTVW